MKLLFGALLLVFSWYSLQILTTANVHNIQGVLEQAAPYTLLALTSGYFTLQKKVNQAMELSPTKQKRIELEEEIKRIVRKYEEDFHVYVKYIDVRRSYFTYNLEDINITTVEH